MNNGMQTGPKRTLYQKTHANFTMKGTSGLECCEGLLFVAVFLYSPVSC